MIRAQAVIGDHLLLEIQDPELGRELWGLDLAEGRPELLRDFDPSPEGSLTPPPLPTAILWRGADFTLLGVETKELRPNVRALWVTDGTVAGTRELSSTVQLFQVIGPVPGTKLVAFSGIDAAHGFGLWVTDGRPEGTRLVFEVQIASGLFSPATFVQWRDRLVFKGESLGSSDALWQTDGTEAGTGPLVDLLPNAKDPVISAPVLVGDAIAFWAFPAEGRVELWQVASPEAAPRRLFTTAGTSATGRVFSSPVAVGDQLFFLAGDDLRGARLWRYSERAPVSLEAITPDFGTDSEIALDISADDGRSLAFWLFDYSARHEHRLWVSDGTVAGLKLLHRVTARSSGFRVTAIHHGQGGFVFGTLNPTDDAEIWRFQASSSTAAKVLSTPSGSPLQQFSIGGRAVFFAFEANGTAVWSSDGSASRPDLLFRVSSLQTSRCFVQVGDKLACFALDAELAGEAWSSAGTPESTRHVLPGPVLDRTGQDTRVDLLQATAGGVYFAGAAVPEPGGLWRTDGTSSGTVLHLAQESIVGVVSAVVDAGTLDYLFVGAESGNQPACGVWAIARTSEAPRCVSTTPVRGGDRTLVHQGLVYFIDGEGWRRAQGFNTPILLGEASGSDGGGRVLAATSRGVYLLRFSSLWATDGTVAGTHQVAEATGTISHLVALRDQLFFNVGGDSGEDDSLWTSDGTEEGTRALLSYPEERVPGPITALGSRLFITAEGPDQWEELWTIDLTAAVPAFRLLKRLRRLDFFEAPAEAVPAGLRVVMRAVDPERGEELWASDGTEAGTVFVADLWPGRLGARPREITALRDGLVAFSAADPDRGREPWITDGTAGGTRRLADVSPGRRSSLPERFALSGDRLFFSATDGTHGREVFAVPLSGLPGTDVEPPAGPWLTSAAVPGFRFKVRIGDAPGIRGVRELDCLPETVCVSGAVPGRAEAFLRVVGPRPNGRLWPSVTKFTATVIEVWIEQLSSGALKHYRLEGARPGFDELPGFFDREGFVP